jgi:hypothetical protein
MRLWLSSLAKVVLNGLVHRLIHDFEVDSDLTEENQERLQINIKLHINGRIEAAGAFDGFL